MFTKKQIISAIKITILSAILIVGLNYANAAWSGPTANPPSGGIPTPVNVSSVNQVKNGGLGVNALSVFGDGLFSRDMTANEFCFSDGKCITSWSQINNPSASSTPTATLTANPTSVAYNGQSVLTWSSTNTTSCSANWTSSTATSGTATKSNLTTSTTYTITCTGTGGSAQGSAIVTVGSAPAAPPAPTPLTLLMTATGGGSTVTTNAQNYPILYINYWESATISWNSTGANECTKFCPNSLNCPSGWTGSVGASGSETFNGTNIPGSKLFSISCNNSSGQTVSQNIYTAIKGPVMSLSVNPHWVNIGDTVNITWSSDNTAVSCDSKDSSGNYQSRWWGMTGATSGNVNLQITQALVDANKLAGSNPWYLGVNASCCNAYGGCNGADTWIRPK